jgi:hypothetical protein
MSHDIVDCFSNLAGELQDRPRRAPGETTALKVNPGSRSVTSAPAVPERGAAPEIRILQPLRTSPLCPELRHLREHQHVVSQSLRESLCGAQSLRVWSAAAWPRDPVDTLFDTLAIESAPAKRGPRGPNSISADRTNIPSTTHRSDVGRTNR